MRKGEGEKKEEKEEETEIPQHRHTVLNSNLSNPNTGLNRQPDPYTLTFKP